MSFVVDASVAIAWAVASQGSADTRALLDRAAMGERLLVGTLWPFEVANTLLMSLRRKRISEVDFQDAKLLMGCLRVSVDEEGHRVATGRTTDLAKEHGLAVYDAAYLELALRKRLPLASRDGDLNRAARDCGVTVLL